MAKQETPRQKATRLIKQHGAILTDDGDTISIEAPAGHVWAGDSLHEMVASKWDDETKADLWADLAERMELGIEKCEDPDCEWCHGEETEDGEAD